MSNPILTGITKNNPLTQNIGAIKEMWGMLKGAGNPQAMLNQIMQNNPKMQEVNELIKQNGGNAEKAFRAKAKEMGVDPNDILNMFR